MIDRIRRLELWPAFKNIAIIFSFSLNMIMLVLVIIAAFWIIPSTNQLAKPIITKLSKSVEDMVSFISDEFKRYEQKRENGFRRSLWTY